MNIINYAKALSKAVKKHDEFQSCVKNKKTVVQCIRCGNEIECEYVEYQFNSEWGFWDIKKMMYNETEGEPTKYHEENNPYWHIPICSGCAALNNYNVWVEKTKRSFANCGIPKEYIQCRFSNYKIYNDTVVAENQRRKIEYLKKIILKWRKPKLFSNIISFLGTNGTGKGHLASALIYDLIRYYKTYAIFAKFDDILRKIRATYDSSENGINEDYYLNMYRNADLLVIDEFGTQERDSAFAMKILNAIVDNRYENGKKTILTSNLYESEIDSYFLHNTHGKRVYSRIFAKENRVLIFDWADYRLERGL